MRVPPFERYTVLMQGAASFVVGAIVGAIVYHSLFMTNFETLRNTVGRLEEKLNQYEKDIRQLRQFKNQHSVVKSVLPILENNRDKEGKPITVDELTKTELKKRLREDLNAFIGTSIYEIDSNARLARLLLDKKIYKGVYEKDYTVEIKTMLVVDNVLQVWFKANVLDPSPG